MITQEGDVLIYQTVDGGEIIVEDGIIEMTGGLETAVYLSLFGGNEDDDGQQDNEFNWWGNLDETETSKQYRSETQNLLQSLPATSNNLKRIEDAVRRDLSWMLETGAASEVTATAKVPAVNTVKIVVGVFAIGQESNFTYSENWKATV